jgi:Cu/Ag efflux protein CusF
VIERDDLQGFPRPRAWHAVCAKAGGGFLTMSNQVKGWITAAVVATFVALPLAASAGQAAPPADPPSAAQAQASSASGELVKVDATAKTLTIKADGRDQEFTFNEQTKITSAQGAAGLATMEGSQVTVMYGKDRVASEIRVTPKK